LAKANAQIETLQVQEDELKSKQELAAKNGKNSEWGNLQEQIRDLEIEIIDAKEGTQNWTQNASFKERALYCKNAYGVEEMAKKKSEIDLRQYLDSQVRPDLLACPRG
jgi:hypothetical protein